MSERTNNTASSESVREVNTAELLKTLSKPTASYSDFLEKNSDCFIENDRTKMWQSVREKCVIPNNDIINRADIGYTFFYDIISDRKTPKREKIIRILLAMNASLDDCQKMLRLYNYANLYPKIKRDSAIIYAFNHSQSIYELNSVLEKTGEEKI